MLKAYQVDRFLAFVDPDLDPRGAGYNVEQARIAIGNGGLFGQGLFHGSQTRSGFVPEQQTDFVFTVAGEELGLVGAGLLILLLSLVIWRALRHRPPRRGRLRPRRRRRHRLLVRLPGLPEHRHVPRDHARHRRTRCRSCPTAAPSLFAGMLAVGLLQNIHLRSQTRTYVAPLAERRVLVGR